MKLPMPRERSSKSNPPLRIINPLLLLHHGGHASLNPLDYMAVEMRAYMAPLRERPPNETEME